MKNFFSNTPSGSLEDKWDKHRFEMKLVNPSNKKKKTVIVVGTGLAGASASATLADLGYQVKTICIQDSARRAHSIAAQGGINAAKNYPNDGDSVQRLFYDTIKGGDFRAREANVYRLAQVSNQIIDHCVALGVPFAREYGGLLANRSFGGAQVSRTFYARGQTGQQLLLGAYSSMMRQVSQGNINYSARKEMMDLIISDEKARGIVVRDLVTGELETHTADAVVLATGGYGNVFYLSTNAKNSNAMAAWRCHKRGALFANPCFTQIHPTCIPVTGEMQSKLTLMSESLRNDGRVWVSKIKGDKRMPHEIPASERDYYLERIYPSFGNLVPRDVASRQAKFRVDEGYGSGQSVFLDFADSISKQGEEAVRAKYGNLFDMYNEITGDNPYQTPMKIYPAVHYTMGGLWVDYNLQSNIEGLFVLGEANFSDHGANRLGASALMQGLSDGYFVIPYTLGNYLASTDTSKEVSPEDISGTKQAVEDRVSGMLKTKGDTTADAFHKKLGKIVWDKVGMSRNQKSLLEAKKEISELKENFEDRILIPDTAKEYNAELQKALRVQDFMDLGYLMAEDALCREESCGAHFREEHQTPEHEALRRDEDFCHVSAWEHNKDNPVLHKEKLEFEKVSLSQRSYK